MKRQENQVRRGWAGIVWLKASKYLDSPAISLNKGSIIHLLIDYPVMDLRECDGRAEL